MNVKINFVNPNTDKVTEKFIVNLLAQAAINRLEWDKHQQKNLLHRQKPAS